VIGIDGLQSLTFQKLIIIDKFMKYVDLEMHAPHPVFTRQDILLAGLKVFDYQLSLWVKKGLLIRLKNGIYAFAREAGSVDVRKLAFLLYQPSYISLESALAYHGFIPEMVYAQTSVTSRTTRTFNNVLGRFIYRHVKKELYWGYEKISSGACPYLMAEPEKAVLDYLYLNQTSIRTQADFESIRLNYEQLRVSLNPDKFARYLAGFNMLKMEKWALQCLP